MLLCSIYNVLYHNRVNLKKIENCIFNFTSLRYICISPLVGHKWGSTKKHRNIKLNIFNETMSDPRFEEILAPLRANVKEQVKF